MRGHHIRGIGLAVLVLATCGFAGEKTSAPIAPEETRSKSILELKSRADKLLACGDALEIRRSIKDVFALVDSLIKSGQENAAFPYLSAALTYDSWAMDYQLLLAEMLLARGQGEPARQKAELVLRYAEKDPQVHRARKLLRQEPPAPWAKMTSSPGTALTLVLVPVGEVDACVLNDLQQALRTRLTVPVVVRDAQIGVPPSKRDAVTSYLARMRENLRKGMEKDQRLEAFLRDKGIRPEDLEQEAGLVKACRQLALASNDPEELAKFDALLERLHQMGPQWDIDNLLESLMRGVAPFRQLNIYFLGVANLDAFAGDSNYIFGTAQNSGHHAIITYRRFTSEFNDETPSRPRLRDRLLKQALSSIGFMLGVPRCSTPTCARAYPHSLPEHDAKSTELCPACRVGIERALGLRLPSAATPKPTPP